MRFFKPSILLIPIIIQLLAIPWVRADVVLTQDVVKTLSILAVMPELRAQTPIVMTDEAQKIYERHKMAVYQIHVINLASGEKSVIGSAFQFTQQGHIATNFHVVSEAVHSPNQFKIELVRFDKTIVDAVISAIDVLHDLAILKIKDGYTASLELGDSELSKGTRIFALGNPLDLGMSIVEGTYNGLLEKSMFRKIHFSGSLNGGMSGGPALDNKARVIGINVSTYGNQVSFLVPVDYLKELYGTIKDDSSAISNWQNVIQNQLTTHQAVMMDSLINEIWKTKPFAEVSVPNEMTNLFKCWGDSKDSGEELYEWASLRCSSQDDIFISGDFRTGRVTYNYVWVNSKGLNPFRFYRVFEYWFSQPFNFDNAKEDDVSNFQCKTGFVRIDQVDWKVILCTRRYKKFPELYDVNLNMASVSKFNKGLLVELVALGVTQEKSQALMRKFMENIRWNK